MIALEGPIGISKVLKSFVNHDRNINKYWINDLHLNFLCCVFYFLRTYIVDVAH